MRLVFAYLLIGLLRMAVGAPLSVQVRCEKDTFLIYEPIQVVVSIHNNSGRVIQLDEVDGGALLDFVVTDEANHMVSTLARPKLGQTASIPPNQAISQAIDLLPLYELRDRGTYRIQAVVRTSAGSFESAPVRITLIHGREIWSQSVGVPVPDGAAEEYRTYTLVARRGPRDDTLYVGVRDEPRRIVYSLVPLGGFLSTIEPQVRVDRHGNLHVLFQNGPRSHGYLMIDPSAKPLKRAAYSDFTSHPTLTVVDGEVSVTGGEQTYPKADRVLTDEELNPPPPPPPPKPKRHWWWPFGPKS